MIVLDEHIHEIFREYFNQMKKLEIVSLIMSLPPNHTYLETFYVTETDVTKVSCRQSQRCSCENMNRESRDGLYDKCIGMVDVIQS